MKKAPLTDGQKLWKRKRDALQMLHNRLLSKWSFSNMRTWEQYYTEAGLSKGEKSGPLTVPELQAVFEQQRSELEKEITNEQNGITLVQTERSEGRKDSVQSIEQSSTSIHTNTTDERSSVLPSSELTVARGAEKTKPHTDGQVELVREDERIPDRKVLSQMAEEFVQNEQNNYGLTDSKNWTVFHYWFQKKAIAQIRKKFKNEHKRGILLVASTGTGKTYMSGAVLRLFEDEHFHEGNDIGRPRTISHIPYLYVTRSSIVTQTERVLRKSYKMGVEQMEVINIEQLRSASGRLWVIEKMDIINGKEEWSWKWKEMINPCVVVWDECQALKNEGSTQHEIACAYNDLRNPETYQLFVSATPFTRVIEAKCFAVSTRRNIEHLGFPKGTILTNATWPAYAAAIASPSKPYEYNEAAVERLMKDLDDYVVRVKGVKPQFEAINSTQLIDFETEEEEKFYRQAWDRYVEEKQKLEALALAEGRDISSAGINELVAFQKFRMAAELCRKEHLAKEMYDIVHNKKKAAICALNFKGSIISVVKILVDKYKVPRSQISLIWGGGQTELTTKQKNKKRVMDLKDKFEAAGMPIEEMLKSLGLDDVEDRIIEELDPSLRLGAQSPADRQVEIDRFQTGQSLYCFFTFRAGGVGLSLHHTDEYSPVKVRRKESGYAVEEDIPNVPIRPRESLIAPTYSAIELVQGLGRAPRLTSLSDTVQRLVFYRNSIEKDVAAIVSLKLKCLGPVVKQREMWMDVMTSRNSGEATQRHLKDVPKELTDGTDDPSQLGGDGEE